VALSGSGSGLEPGWVSTPVRGLPGASIDREHDDADVGQRKIHCPLLLLWSGRGALPRLYGDVLDVWRPWAEQVTGHGLDATHFLVEDQPEKVAAELMALLSTPAGRTIHR